MNISKNLTILLIAISAISAQQIPLQGDISILVIRTSFAQDDDVSTTGGGSILTGNSTTPIVGAGHVNTLGYHTLFIHSELGLQGDSLTCTGETSVVRRVVLDRPQGSMVHDFRSLLLDYVRVPKSLIRQLHFRLSDWLGRTVELQNSWSFSVISVPEDEI